MVAFWGRTLGAFWWTCPSELDWRLLRCAAAGQRKVTDGGAQGWPQLSRPSLRSAVRNWCCPPAAWLPGGAGRLVPPQKPNCPTVVRRCIRVLYTQHVCTVCPSVIAYMFVRISIGSPQQASSTAPARLISGDGLLHRPTRHSTPVRATPCVIAHHMSPLTKPRKEPPREAGAP